MQLPEVERDIGWRELADMARAAEASGLDSVWVGDHLLYREPPRGPWEAWTLLAALAAVTSRVEIAPLVACLGFHNPAMLAKSHFRTWTYNTPGSRHLAITRTGSRTFANEWTRLVGKSIAIWRASSGRSRFTFSSQKDAGAPPGSHRHCSRSRSTGCTLRSPLSHAKGSPTCSSCSIRSRRPLSSVSGAFCRALEQTAREVEAAREGR